MGRQLLKAKRFGILEAALALALLFIFLLSIGMGRYYIPLADVVKVLLGRTEDLSASVVAIISNSRLPRAAAAVFVGMALSASGVAYQAVFSNPMAAPDVLGAASGSACGAALGILLANSDLIIQLMAFIFGLGAVLLTLFLSKVVGKGKSTVIYLLLVGMVISALFKSGISIIKYFADVEDTLPAITFWLMGGLSNVKREQVSVVVPIILISLFFLLANKWKLNLLTFGDEEAAAMGVNVQRTRALVIIFSTLMSSAAISVCGLIGWVGIVVPHCARLLVGANNQRVLPVATLLGGVYLMIIDLLARMLLMVEIPLGILTALIGTPFLWILFRGQILRGTE